QRGKRIDRVTPEIRRLAADMIDTMYAAHGVGLAAQQVGQALQLTVIDVSSSEQPWEMTPSLPQPVVLINPVLLRPQGEQVGPEGCLSIPGISADVRRAEQITVRAQDLEGRPVEFVCRGLLARAAQHEVDHLNGILFVDRLDAATRASLNGALKRLREETLAALPRTARR
ncbi:MAG: peptide deformylase, partial [Verrucomicrobiae bacterium]|nr:peptide deformylase [Verrucomicrobiae bacterium]